MRFFKGFPYFCEGSVNVFLHTLEHTKKCNDVKDSVLNLQTHCKLLLTCNGEPRHMNLQSRDEVRLGKLSRIGIR